MKQNTSSSTTANILAAVAFLDGVVGFCGIAIMVAHSKHVSFPSGLYITAYQLTHMLPRMFTSFIAEYGAKRVGATACLALALIGGILSAYTIAMSLQYNLLPLFFAAKLINGLCRHDKLLLRLSSKEQGVDGGRVQAAATWGILAGLISSGMAADRIPNVVTIQYGYVVLEMVAFFMALNSFLMTYPHKSVTIPASESTPAYTRWLQKNVLLKPRYGPYVAALLMCCIAAGVHQCMYPLMAPRFGLSFTFTAVQLALHIMSQQWIIAAKRYALRAVRRASTVRLLEHAIAVLSAVVFICGSWIMPTYLIVEPMRYYAGSFFLIDVPAALLQAYIIAEFVESTPATQRLFGERAVGHVIMTAKMFSSAVRVVGGEALGVTSAVRFLTILPTFYVLIFLLSNNSTRSFVATLSVAVAAIAYLH